MQELEIRELEAPQLVAAAAVLGRGMRDNPLHVAAFGLDPARRETILARMFLAVLRQYLPKGAVLVAWRDGQLVGVCAMVGPGRCQPAVSEKLRMLPFLCASMSLRSLGAMLRWTGAWARHDPADRHWHLGPVAVDRDWQGHGVGKALLAEFCRRMDAQGAAAYLETDKDVNVPFYQRHGFRTTGQAEVLGVPNWFMFRAAVRGAAGTDSHLTGA